MFEAAEREINKVIAKGTPEEQASVLRYFLDSSLYLHCKFGMGYKDVNLETHGEMIDALEAPTRNKLLIMPRGTLKSSITCESYPIWMLNKNPDLRIFIDSKLYDNSKNFIRVIRTHMGTGGMFSFLYGQYESSVWNEGELIIKQRKKVLKEPSLMAIGVGTTKVGQHCDILIHDDMNDKDNSDTPEGCEKIVDHYKYNKSILERKTGISIIQATRYAANDLPGHAINNEIPSEVREKLKREGFI